jgi:flagellin
MLPYTRILKKEFKMSFRINTNVNALNSSANAGFTQRNIQNSLEKLSSGLRINKAADDASGMAIADSLRSQANALGQAIRNTNDGIGIIQIADKAMDEQIKILDTIKTKATQAAQDGQTTKTRQAIQADINRLIEGLDYIGNTTSFNGQALLSGQYTNKEFQVGAYSNQTIKTSIGATTSDKIGQTRVETSGEVGVSGGASSLQTVTLKFVDVDGKTDITLESAKISTSAGTGIGNLVEVINKNSDRINVKASFTVQGTGSTAVASGTVQGLTINGITLGTIYDIQKNDSDGRLVAAINAAKDRTGVEAYVDSNGRLNVKSGDGRAIDISTTSAGSSVMGGGNFANVSGGAASNVIIGRISLTRLDARDIVISGTNNALVGLQETGGNGIANMAQTTANLRDVRGSFNMTVACAAGANYNSQMASDLVDNDGIGAGVTSLRGAMVVMDIAEAAIKNLDTIRSDMGSVQNQMVSTMNNITITQVNVKAAESGIREVDFASESSEFSKQNILAQSGSYALSQSNAVQQNVLRLLQ